MYELAIKICEELKNVAPIAIYDDDCKALLKIAAPFVEAGYKVTVEKVDEE